MDAFRQQQLQQSIAATIAEALSRHDWANVTVFFSQVGTSSSSSFRPRDADGNKVDVRPPRYEKDFKELRVDMADPSTGAWFSTELSLSRDGAMKFTFNYTDRVYWHGSKPGDPAWQISPNDRAYLDDLRKFPRQPQHVPDWVPSSVRAPGEGQAAEIDELLVRPLALPPELESLRATEDWPDVLTSLQAGIQKNVRDSADDILLDAEYRPRLAEVLDGLRVFIIEYVYNDVLANQPVSSLQRLAAQAGPVIGSADDLAPIGVSASTPLRDAMHDLGVSDRYDVVARVVSGIADADLESRFGVRPAP